MENKSLKISDNFEIYDFELPSFITNPFLYKFISFFEIKDFSHSNQKPIFLYFSFKSMNKRELHKMKVLNILLAGKVYKFKLLHTYIHNISLFHSAVKY